MKTLEEATQVRPELVPLLREAVVALREEFGERLREVTLFGSQARGDATEASDVDLLVVVENPTWQDRDTAVNALMPAVIVAAYREVVVPLVLSPQQCARLREEDWPLARDVDAQGVSLWNAG